MRKNIFILTFFMSFIVPKLQSQNVMMQGWYWDYPKAGNGHNWADTLKQKATELGNAGITHMWIPPHVKASSGSFSNGYDPRDLYDVGQHGPTGLGTKTGFDAMVQALQNNGIEPVADMVYNHRDGGLPEYNPSAEGWIKNFNNPSNHPYPSDRFRTVLAIGGSTGKGAGDYYISIRSATGNTNFQGKPYRVYLETHRQGWQDMPDDNEGEPNNGSGQFKEVILGRNYDANVDNGGGIDEYKLTLTDDDFFAAGDSLYIYFTNQNGDYSDHFIWNGNGSRDAGLWYDNGTTGVDIMSDVKYQTYTDFTSMPSGQGAMNHSNFKPNGSPTNLGGFPGDYGWDHMVFFYDYDQFNTDTKNKLFEWTKWNWETLGVRGLRVDAIKHFTPEFMGDLLDYMHDLGYAPGIVIGEWYGTNIGELSGWVNDVLFHMDDDTKSVIQPKIFDFALREELRQACDGFGYDARNVFNNSLNANGVSGFNIVTFANNHDFRRDEGSGFESLIHNDPMLAYAYILTNNQIGVPTVFYPDYYGYKPDEFSYHPDNVNPMKDEINQLLAVHQEHITNANQVIYLNNFASSYLADANYIEGYDNTTLLYQLNGGISGKKVIVAINFAGETLRLDHRVDAGVGTTFTDILGRSNFPTGIVDSQNRLYFEVPARSYSIWVEGEVAPLRPLNLLLEEVDIFNNHIDIAWTEQASNEENIIVERQSNNSGTWEVIATLSANTNEYQDTAIELGNEYAYRVKASNSTGDSEYSNEVEVIFDGGVGIDDNLKKHIKIYPNPSEGIFKLEIQDLRVEQGSFQILNTEGKVILEKTLSQTNDVDISSQSKGIYYLQVNIHDRVYTQKIILK